MPGASYWVILKQMIQMTAHGLITPLCDTKYRSANANVNVTGYYAKLSWTYKQHIQIHILSTFNFI